VLADDWYVWDKIAGVVAEHIDLEGDVRTYSFSEVIRDLRLCHMKTPRIYIRRMAWPLGRYGAFDALRVKECNAAVGLYVMRDDEFEARDERPLKQADVEADDWYYFDPEAWEPAVCPLWDAAADDGI
jgi:hypothetical protein